ncbi:Transcriptional regulator [hydrothermal vent metagenome]|uniref:Transcriptional regulator n=1 Tax=hydrothermal vent metagenome TaxID=652676 RepID=A0A3B0R8H4_9ZZZZ
MSDNSKLLKLTSNIVAAYVGNNKVPIADLPNTVQQVYVALTDSLRSSGDGQAAVGKPAVPVGKSIFADYIICLEDGQKFKSLKRHLRAKYDLSPEEYRKKWGLPTTYPMVAPEYAKIRSALAKQIGLGRRGKKKPAEQK